MGVADGVGGWALSGKLFWTLHEETLCVVLIYCLLPFQLEVTVQLTSVEYGIGKLQL